MKICKCTCPDDSFYDSYKYERDIELCTCDDIGDVNIGTRENYKYKQRSSKRAGSKCNQAGSITDASEQA